MKKGYNGSAIVIPKSYSSHSAPALHVAEVLDNHDKDRRVGVFAYAPPDKSSSRPFQGRLETVRSLHLGTPLPGAKTVANKPTTQWAHVREGSLTRDAAYRYLQSAMRLASGTLDESESPPPEPLQAAVRRIDSEADVRAYLANTADESFGSRVWRHFWLNQVATPEVLNPFIKKNSSYSAPGALSNLEKDDGTGRSQFFEGRNNGLKETICGQLNAGKVTEAQAWEAMAQGLPIPGKQNKQGVRDRAHSFREDLDSALAQLKLIDGDGRPTETGYKYVSICERFGSSSAEAAKDYFGSVLIQDGRYGTFLHYIHRLSEEAFSSDPLAFADLSGKMPVFNENSYWDYLGHIRDKLVDDLRVMSEGASLRNRPRSRTLFQAELTFLRNYGFLSPSRSQRYRLGVGLPINWVRVHESMAVEL